MVGGEWNMLAVSVAVAGSCLKKSIDRKMQAISSDLAISLLWRGRCGCMVSG
jgi:hypothetical protein